ncbi:thioredoxin domain-containing protein [Clostridium gasigenes]|uniref:Thioredoxin domain-containing protein n=1 Tax=Clostridium gasigenes TaxID=94869 RepID=A0A7X0VR37_9CLOT|nr:thioredoxin domain-containing protein [Clostridium gasigenes]MBB6713131.1 hypothetical protein [Clostridium gasigenes]
MKKISSILISMVMIINFTFLNVSVNAAELENGGEIYDKIPSINFSQIFTQEDEEYVVYFYKNNCPYCIMIKPDLQHYADKNNYKNVYTANMDNFENKHGWYDMKIHHERYDIEIGEIDANGNVVYYEGESAKKYTNGDIKTEDGKVIDYRMFFADEANYEGYKKNANVNIQRNKVYAADFTKRINLKDNEAFKIIGVPTAIKVKNGKVSEYYQGASSVQNFFNR